MTAASERSMGTIAVVGASRRRDKFGNKAVRAYLAEGWEVYPVNPGAAEIEGVRAWARMADVPAELDRVTVYLPPELTLELLPEIAARRPGVTFFNPGAADDRVLERARELGLEFRAACSIVDIGRSPAEFP